MEKDNTKQDIGQFWSLSAKKRGKDLVTSQVFTKLQTDWAFRGPKRANTLNLNTNIYEGLSDS
jgi:hypothetical protein